MNAQLELMIDSSLLVFLSLTINVVYSFIIFYFAITKTKREITDLVQKLPFLAQEARAPSTCLHYLGYLHTYSRKKRIPEGCWGCSELLECAGQEPSAEEKEKWKTLKKTASSTKAKTKPKKNTRKKKS